MELSEVPDVLKSSVLAPIFEDLDDVKVEEKENLSILKIGLKNHVDESSPFMVVFLDNSEYQIIRIHGVAQTKDKDQVARVGHVNHMVVLSKLCWDPEDGEVYVQSSALRQAESGMSPANFEKMLAESLQIFFGERIWFMSHEVSALVNKNIVSSEQGKALINAVADHFKSSIDPLIRQVI